MLSRSRLYEYAKLAQQTYNLEKNETVSLPANWYVWLKWIPEGGWENLYGLFVNEKRKEVVLVIRGTENVSNIITDFNLVVGALRGKHQLPPGQHDVEDLARTIHRHMNPNFVYKNTKDIENIQAIEKSIPRLEGEVGIPISKWIIALLCIAAITSGIYTISQFSSLDVVTELVAQGILVERSMPALFRVVLEATEQIKMILQREPESMSALKTAVTTAMKITFPDFIFKIVGHSLGAVMAELCAAELEVECISFESPGSLGIMEQVTRYQGRRLNITSYLTAPNIINTLNGHPGEHRYRLFLPHTDGKLSYWHQINCVFDETSRIASYVSFGYFGYGLSLAKTATQEIEKKLVKEIAKEIVKEIAVNPVEIASYLSLVHLGSFLVKTVAQAVIKTTTQEIAKKAAQEAAKKAAYQVGKRAVISAVSTKGLGGVVGLWKSLEWLIGQHGIDSIVSYLDDQNDLPVKTAEILSWPQVVILNRFLQKVTDTLRACFIPFQKDLPGIHNLFDEESMREAQVSRIANYSVDQAKVLK